MKISIITAAYNNCQTLQRTIDSLRRQTYRNVEHIVVYSPSTDCTWQIIQQNRSKIDVVLQQPPHGIYSALNAGIAAATGEIIGILHADDYFATESILEQVFRKFSEGYQVVYGDLKVVSATGELRRVWKAGEFSRRKLFCGWMPPHTATFIHRQLYSDFGLYRTDMTIAADYHLLLKILLTEPKVAYVPKTFVVMQWGGTSTRNLRQWWVKFVEDLQAAWDILGFWALIDVPCKKLRKLGQLRLL